MDWHTYINTKKQLDNIVVLLVAWDEHHPLEVHGMVHYATKMKIIGTKVSGYTDFAPLLTVYFIALFSSRSFSKKKKKTRRRPTFFLLILFKIFLWRAKVSVNNGQLRLWTPPWMGHANCPKSKNDQLPVTLANTNPPGPRFINPSFISVAKN